MESERYAVEGSVGLVVQGKVDIPLAQGLIAYMNR